MLTGPELRTLRLERGLTQADVADLVGASRSWVASVERGWIRITEAKEAAIREHVATQPKREDVGLHAHNVAMAARATQHEIAEHECVRCGKPFLGAIHHTICSTRCLRETLAWRRSTADLPEIGDAMRAVLLDAMDRTRPEVATQEEFAARHGLSQQFVGTYLRWFGVTLANVRPRSADADPVTLARDRDIARRYIEGVTFEAIGEAYGLTGERVRQLLAAMGVTGVDRRDGAQAAADFREYYRQWSSRRSADLPDIRQLHREAVGRALRAQRVRAGLTQRELGEIVGGGDYSSPQATVSSWERGRWNLTFAAREWLLNRIRET